MSETLKLRTDVWCPYACDPKSEQPGFMIEIVKEVFAKHGYQIDYELLNWARAIADTRKGLYDGIIGASRSDVVGFVIPKIPIGKNVNYFYVNRDNTWTYTGVTSLDKKSIGVINDYSYGDEVDGLIEKKHPSFVKLSGDEPLSRLIQMTENKRLDGFIENANVLKWAMKKKNKDIQNLKIASHNICNDSGLYIAFSPNKNKSKIYAKILDDGILELRKTGKLKKILAKYNLEDWN